MPKKSSSRRSRKEASLSSRKKAAGPIVQKVSSQKPEARDEGPRLIPFKTSTQKDPLFPSNIQHAIDLADICLGTKKPKPKSEA